MFAFASRISFGTGLVEAARCYDTAPDGDSTGSRLETSTGSRVNGVRTARRWAVVCALAAVPAVIVLVFGSSAATFSGSGLAGELASVSALSSSNAWAVGDALTSPSDIGDFKTVTEHWHGTTWSRVN